MSPPPDDDFPAAVILDLDGVLVDSETVWDDARRALVRDTGGQWSDNATTDMMGMSSPEWSRYLQDRLGVPLASDDISARVARRVMDAYATNLPLVPGALEAVRALGARFPLALASSSNREVIERFLDASGLRPSFAVTVSSEEVRRGKPAPDVYLEAARRLAVQPGRAVAVEDSTNGIRSARAAGMRVIAVPNPHFPPEPDALALAARVLRSLDELPDTVASIPAV